MLYHAPMTGSPRSDPPADAVRLSPAQQRVLRAVARSVVPEAAGLDEAGWQELEAIVVRAIGQRPPRVRGQILLFLRVLDTLALLRRGRRLTAMDDAPRTAFLRRIERSRVAAFRRGLWGLRTLALMGYYGRRAAAAEIGYRADPRGWEARQA